MWDDLLDDLLSEVPDSGPNLVIAVGIDKDRDLVVQALDLAPDPPGTTCLGYRFLLGRVEGFETPIAVHYLTEVHRCSDPPGVEEAVGSGECEKFYAPGGETNIKDVPEEVRESIAADLPVQVLGYWEFRDLDPDPDGEGGGDGEGVEIEIEDV